MTKEELEKEARDYANKNETRGGSSSFGDITNYHDLRQGYLAGAEPREKRIAELEKEKAELKTDYEVLSCSVGDFDELQNKLEEEQRKNNGLSDNLTKAKKIIKALLRLWNDVMTEETVKALIAEAEQFLSEVDDDNIKGRI